MVNKRKIPVISLEDFKAKLQKGKVYKSLVENITEGIKLGTNTVNVAEIKYHDVIISVPKTEWKAGLKNAMDYYIKTEEYEECSKIKKLIKKL